MARREVLYEGLTADEICWELYGVAKGALLTELAHERRRVRALAKSAAASTRTPRPVPGPTFQAMTWPEYRHYLEGGRDADT
jgi:hypothetical protein